MIGKTISHYKILDKLGEGGMGVVYKAEDTELEREVAIKFLPHHIAANTNERARFKVEAKAAAGLNHPNIATIYSIEEANDEMFIVMEYIKGQELKDKIEAGPLAIDLTLELAIQIAKGLQAAHEKGVVHRDIKSANLMLTDKGDVKILDFGLAKLRGQTKLTKEGTTLGTVAYMSPEQARGGDVDHRSDIFSLGVLLYEMLRGQLPFKGDYEHAVIYSIMNEDPQSIVELRNDVPEQLAQLTEKALKKEQNDRYDSMDDILAVLQDLRYGVKDSKSTEEEKTIPSIAVLPFVNMSADPENEYFSDGLAEDLINALTKIKDFRVAARTSAFSFKDEKIDIREIGRKLNVETVLEGSVRKAGNHLRITAQLINVADGYHLWSEQYDRVMADVFAIQDEITLAIVDALKIELLVREKAAIIKRYTDNLEAYQLYLKGRFYWNQRTDEALKTALGYFQQAIDRDPTYAAAYAGLSDCYGLFSYYAVLPAIESIPKAKSAALKALQIDAQLAEAHTSLALAYQSEWEWELSDKSYRCAIELNPNYSTDRHWYGQGLYYRGRFEEGIAELKQALAVDPHSLIINATFGNAYIVARRYDLALEHLKKTLNMDEDFYMTHFWIGKAYVLKNQTAKGIEHLKEALRLSDSPEVLAGLGYTYGISGNIMEAEKTLVEMDKLSSKRFVSPYHEAMIYAGLGDKEKALELLELSLEQRSVWLGYIKVDPFWDNLRSDPRFIELLKKVGFEK